MLKLPGADEVQKTSYANPHWDPGWFVPVRAKKTGSIPKLYLGKQKTITTLSWVACTTQQSFLGSSWENCQQIGRVGLEGFFVQRISGEVSWARAPATIWFQRPL